MRCFVITCMAVAAALWSPAYYMMAEEAKSPAEQPPGELRIVEPPDQPAQVPTDGAPTPAKRLPAKPAAEPTELKPKSPLVPPAVKLDVADAASKTAEKPPESTAPKAAESEAEQENPLPPDDDSLKPIPDPLLAPPPKVEPASFNGITPGATSRKEVEQALGQPLESSEHDGRLVLLYEVKPFSRVEISLQEGVVSSIVIRFGRSFPADAVAKQLDLSVIRPVTVVNERGEVLGMAYPERGVLFTFEPAAEPGKASMKVPHVIIEPISAESFVLRAETTLDSHRELAKRDLEQALKLDPENARAHWLLSRVLAATDRPDEALSSAGKAVKLAPDDPQYRLTLAQTLAQAGRLEEAFQQAEKAAESSGNRPHMAAKATCLLGDLTASGGAPDFNKALGLHTQAIQMADRLAADPHPAVRMAAKEVLVDAHLGAAHDIAWGEFQQKSRSVARWLERAINAADDLVDKEGGSPDIRFRAHVRWLAACVGLRGEMDPAPGAKAVQEIGEKLIAAADAPGRKSQLQRELGTARYDAVQVCQMRAEDDNALKHGVAAAKYLSAANQAKPIAASAYLLGRLYFRLGAIEAINHQDHKAAVVWFDKALPLLNQQPAAETLAGEPGRHGEALVSMGVSYWQTGRQQKALELTEKGIKWMERAVKQGSMNRSALAVPYANLATMHRNLGAADLADHFQELAGRVKEGRLK